MVCVGLWYHSGTTPHGLVALALVLVIFTIFAAVRLHVQLVRFGRFVRSERARLWFYMCDAAPKSRPNKPHIKRSPDKGMVAV